MSLEELQQCTEMDLAGSLERFGGMKAVYVRFLKKLPGDTSYKTLLEAVNAKDYKTVESSAHTLKGVCGNLGLTGLYRASARIVTAVRENREAEVEALFAELKEEMEKVLPALEKLA